MPYIIADENKVIEKLLKHVYSRSVAEVIHRIMHIVESNFEDDISNAISEKKQSILTALMDKLACEEEDETVMNATFILQDLIEQRGFFAVLTKRQNMQKMFDIAFNPDRTDMDSCFYTQGLIMRFVQQFNDRQTKSLDSNRFDNSGDDDIIVNEISDDENDEAKNNNNAAIVELLVKMVEPLKAILERPTQGAIPSSFNQVTVLPLGRIKLRAVELLSSILSLKRQPVTQALADS